MSDEHPGAGDLRPLADFLGGGQALTVEERAERRELIAASMREGECATCGGARYVRRGEALVPCAGCLAEIPLDARLRRSGFGGAKPFSEWRRGSATDAIMLACAALVRRERWCVFARSGVGSGKTHAAMSAGRAWIERDGSARFWSVPELVQRMRDTHREDSPLELTDFIARNVTYAELLVLDDMGADRVTPFAAEQIYRIVNAYYNAREEGRFLIVTTNVAPGSEEEAERFSARVLDRLSPGEVIVRDAPSRRKEFDA